MSTDSQLLCGVHMQYAMCYREGEKEFLFYITCVNTVGHLNLSCEALLESWSAYLVIWPF